MYIAINKNGERICADDADSGLEYFCPICNEQVRLKNGMMRVAHFAHKVECKDTWHYDMSEWHKHKQEFFSEEYREVVVVSNGIKHRADVLKDGVVIEFQHSPISVEEYCDRNNFYTSLGYKVVWVFDITEQYENGQLAFDMHHENQFMMQWKNPKQVLRYTPTQKSEKNVFIWLAWDCDEYEDCLQEIIWNTPDYRRILLSNLPMDMQKDMDAKELCYTKYERMMNEVKKFPRYSVKKSRQRGYRRESYVCPKTSKFGIEVYGEGSCRYCKHCITIEKLFSNKFESDKYNIYCAYPQIARESVGDNCGDTCDAVYIYE